MSVAVDRTLKDIVILDHTESDEDSGDVHEIQFLEIVVSSPILSLDRQFVFVTHNKHNGYYEGFELLIEYHTELTI